MWLSGMAAARGSARGATSTVAALKVMVRRRPVHLQWHQRIDKAIAMMLALLQP